MFNSSGPYMVPLKMSGIISDSGKLSFDDSDIVRNWLLRHSGKKVDLTFQSHSETKTQPQYGYLFGHIIPQIADYTGYSEEEVYGVLKYKFLRKQIDYRDGQPVFSVSSLSDSSITKEVMAKFIGDCIAFGTELGAEIYPSEFYGGTP